MDKTSSEEYNTELTRLTEIRESICSCLLFCFYDSSRDGKSHEKNFFLRMVDDFLQSIIVIESIAKEGAVNICRRELRYIIELAIKSYLILQNSKKSNFEDQIREYKKALNSSNINQINILDFMYLRTHSEDFKTDVKKLYGFLSKYTHSSSHQILERLSRVESGITIGYEGPEELRNLNNDIEKTFSIIAVFIFHSVAQYVVGDFLVENNGDSKKWHFNQSKYVNIIDENFDYKSERQYKLDSLKQERLARTKFI